MGQSMYLQGSEEVDRASHRMESAANDMLRAANLLDSTVDRLRHILDEFATRMEALNADATGRQGS